MNLGGLLETLADTWEELPSLLGARWADLFPRVRDLVEALGRTQDNVEAASLVRELVLLFKNSPVAERFLAVLRDETYRGTGNGDRHSQGPDPETAFRAGRAAISERVDPPALTRYMDVTAPARLSLRQRDVIVVRFTPEPAAGAKATSKVEARRSLPIYVELLANPADFEVEGDPVRRLELPPEGASEPAVFYVTAATSGDKVVHLDCLQGGSRVGTVSLTIVVDEEEKREGGASHQDHRGIPVELGGSYAPPADIDLRITLHHSATHNSTTLGFTLSSPNGTGYVHFRAGTVTLQAPPEAYKNRLYEKIEGLRGEVAQARLRAYGEELYQELFPSELRRAFRELHATSVRSLQITSDEPWIPWELVYQYDNEDPADPHDGDFLCARFECTRWLPGKRGPRREIRVSHIACVDAGRFATPALTSTGPECRHLLALGRGRGATDLSPPPTAPAVLGALQVKMIDLWHFAAHGDDQGDKGDRGTKQREPTVTLGEGTLLRPDDLHGSRQNAITLQQPLVFMNTCRAANLQWSLSQLAGWAAAWVGRCRCGGFVGPMWAVTDRVASLFATTFYDELAAGRSVGRAVAAARARARDEHPDDPTWLAYSVYGHPNGRVVFPKD